MAKLIAATILPDHDLAGQVQVELTWERPAIKLKDWKALHKALDEGGIPIERSKEVRAYATRELADLAIAQLAPAMVTA